MSANGQSASPGSFKGLSAGHMQWQSDMRDAWRARNRRRAIGDVWSSPHQNSSPRRITAVTAPTQNAAFSILGPDGRQLVDGQPVPDEDDGRLQPFKRVQRSYGRAARKTVEVITIDDSSESQSDIDSSDDKEPPSDSAESENEDDILSSDEDEVLVLEAPPAGPSDLLLDAMASLSLPTIRLQKTNRLPFLRRVLRRCFQDRCQRQGVPVAPARPPARPLRVVVKLTLNGSSYSWKSAEWACPFCELLGPFSTREMFITHLEWDHAECLTTWKNQFHVTFHIAKAPDSFEVPSLRPAKGEEHETPIPSAVSRNALYVSALSVRQEPEPEPVLSDSFAAMRDDMTAMNVSVDTPAAPAPSATGPRAQYPYITSEDRDKGLHYSCRPGGPRLYDVLGTLDMDRFGVMSWYIIDQEEEIFERDYVQDEDKVMQALWTRWIFRNQNKFIEDHFKGCHMFIDEYYEMIDRAAGWDALRVWFVTLAENRFISLSQAAKLMRVYEEKVPRSKFNAAQS